MQFQHHLKRERDLRGWSQVRLAQELGTTANSISAWERGISLPSPYFRSKLCELFQKNAQELGLLEDDEHAATGVHEAGRHEQSTSGSVAVVSETQNVTQLESTPLPPPPIDQNTLDQLPSTKKRSRRLLVLISLPLLLALILTLVVTAPHLMTPANPYISKGNLILDESLNDQNPQTNWQEGRNVNNASCQFKAGSYHAFQPLQGYFHACTAQLTNFSNFTYEVEMTLLQGDYAGILFRAVDSIDSHYYVFTVDTTGSYTLKRYSDASDSTALLMDSGVAHGYHAGYERKNLLAVVADDDRLTLYSNGEKLVTVNDSMYTHGQIGVIAGAQQHAPAEASFSHVRVWTW